MKVKSLQVKITLTICALWVACSLGLIFFSYRQINGVLNDSIRTRLRDYAALGAMMIPGEAHATLSTRTDEAAPVYADAVRRLKQLVSSNPDIHFAYTVRKSADGKVSFVVDSTDPGPDHVSPGDPYDDASPLLVEAAGKLAEPVVEKEFYTDKWGQFLSAYAPILNADGSQDGVLCIDMSVHSIRGILLDHTLKLLFLMLLSFAFILPASVILSRNIVLPVREYVGLTRHLAENDYSRTVPESFRRRQDEIGELGNMYETMVENTNVLVRAIKDQSSVLSGIGDDLSANMNETAASVNQINGNIQEIRNQTLSQSASVTETISTMEQIIGNLAKLKTDIDRQASTVTQSSASIEEMLANTASVTETLAKNAENVRDLTLASEGGRSDLAAVSDSIRDIAKKSEGLVEISEVIETIASQTNLLSMNAAIEAAHAGDAGKGFSVVADEIRKLAESSGSQSKAVSESLRKIRDAMYRISQETDTVVGQFEEIDRKIRTVSERDQGIREAMNEQNSGSKEILCAIGELNDITSHVKTGFDEMLTGSQEVIHESVNLGRITEEVSGRIVEMVSGVGQITVAVNLVNETSQANRESIGVLLREVDRFRVRECV